MLYDRIIYNLVSKHGMTEHDAKELVRSRPVLVRVMTSKHATSAEIAKNLANNVMFSTWIAKKKAAGTW